MPLHDVTAEECRRGGGTLEIHMITGRKRRERSTRQCFCHRSCLKPVARCPLHGEADTVDSNALAVSDDVFEAVGRDTKRPRAIHVAHELDSPDILNDPGKQFQSLRGRRWPPSLPSMRSHDALLTWRRRRSAPSTTSSVHVSRAGRAVTGTPSAPNSTSAW